MQLVKNTVPRSHKKYKDTKKIVKCSQVISSKSQLMSSFKGCLVLKKYNRTGVKVRKRQRSSQFLSV